MQLNDSIRRIIDGLYMSTPDSVHTVCLGRKFVGGQDTGRIAIVFGVDAKLPRDQIPRGELIPASLTIDGQTVETDVQERLRVEMVSCYAAGSPEIARLQPSASGAAMLLPMRGGQEIIQFPTGWEPAAGGGFQIALGTLGFFAVDNSDGKIVGITNSHVAIDKRVYCSERENDGYNVVDPILWPADGQEYPPGALSANGGGSLFMVSTAVKRYVPVSLSNTNYSDVAVLAINPNAIDANSYKIWAPTTVSDPFTSFLPFATTAEIDGLVASNPRLYSTGRTTGPKGFVDAASCRLRTYAVGASALVSDSSLGVDIDWGDTIVFEYEDASANPVAGGDSGSALVALIGGTYKIIGLVFAGNSQVGIASRIDRVAAEMNIRAWDGTLDAAPPPPASRFLVPKDDPRAGQTSFVHTDGKTYWQAGFIETNSSSSSSSSHLECQLTEEECAALNVEYSLDLDACQCVCPPGKDSCSTGCFDPCPEGRVRNQGNCQCDCPEGQVECGAACWDECPPDRFRNANTGCQCDCLSPNEDCNGTCLQTCSFPRTRDLTTCACKCPEDECGGNCVPYCGGNKVRNVFCMCECPGGLSEECNGSCYEPCGINASRDPQCNCQCIPPGQEFCNGNCYDPCPAGQTRGQDCQCS